MKKQVKQNDSNIKDYSSIDPHFGKSIDKVEPKFKVGDWIICCYYEPIQIINIRTNAYEMSNGNIHPFYTIDNNHNIRLWTLNDVKDGDILSNGDMILIFKEFEMPAYKQHIIAYIGLDNSGHIQVTDESWMLGIDKAKPATKEQRDILMKAMAEAGYEWDSEKKELKKIGRESAWSEEDLPEFESYLCLMFQKFRTKGICTNGEIIDYVKEHSQKLKDTLCHAWSEDDESYLNTIIFYLKDTKKFKKTAENCINWLKYLKDRFQPQPKQE